VSLLVATGSDAGFGSGGATTKGAFVASSGYVAKQTLLSGGFGLTTGRDAAYPIRPIKPNAGTTSNIFLKFITIPFS
jgi:hypothetical protein